MAFRLPVVILEGALPIRFDVLEVPEGVVLVGGVDEVDYGFDVVKSWMAVFEVGHVPILSVLIISLGLPDS